MCTYLHADYKEAVQESWKKNREGTKQSINSLRGGVIQSTGGRIDLALQWVREGVDAGLCIGLVVGDQGFLLRGIYFSRIECKGEK